MAMGDNNNESTFNEAYLKMQRIHNTQETINELRTNQLAFNPSYQKYNYEVIISCLISLCYEVAPLMRDIEKEEFFLLRSLIDDLLNYKPVHEVLSSSSLDGLKEKNTLNIENWNILKKTMLKFEDFARDQIDKHGMGSPKKKDAGSAAIDL